MHTVIFVLVAAALAWLVYLGHGKVVRAMYRHRRDGDDPIERAYAPEIAGVEQTAGLLHASWFFVALVVALVVGVGFSWIVLSLLIGLVAGVPVVLWERNRVRDLTT
jgi:hypothetical protein